MKRKNIAAARSAGVSSAKSKVRKGTVKQVLRYVGKYPFSLSATLLLAIVTVGFTLYVPILIGDAMDCIVEAGKVDFSALKLIFFKIGASWTSAKHSAEAPRQIPENKIFSIFFLLKFLFNFTAFLLFLCLKTLCHFMPSVHKTFPAPERI